MKKRGNGEGSIYFDKSRGKWVAAIVINGQRYKRTANTHKEAIGLRDELLRTMRVSTPKTRNPLTVSALLDDWLEKRVYVQSNVASTTATKQWAVEHIKRQLGSTRLNKLDFAHAEDAFRKMAGHPLNLSEASIIKIRSTFSQAVDWAVRRHLLDRNPVKVAEMPKTKATSPRTSLTVDEVQRLIGAFSGDRLEALWMILVGCGLRSGEARALRWDDWNRSDGTLAVRGSVREGKEGLEISSAMKTDSSRRTLSLPAAVSDALERHRTADLALGGSDSKGLIFRTSTGRILDSSNLRKQLNHLCRIANVPVVTVHELRHTCASILADKGVAAERIADVLGHKSVRTTVDTYRHILSPSVDGLVDTMDEVLF